MVCSFISGPNLYFEKTDTNIFKNISVDGFISSDFQRIYMVRIYRELWSLVDSHYLEDYNKYDNVNS